MHATLTSLHTVSGSCLSCQDLFFYIDQWTIRYPLPMYLFDPGADYGHIAKAVLGPLRYFQIIYSRHDSLFTFKTSLTLEA